MKMLVRQYTCTRDSDPGNQRYSNIFLRSSPGNQECLRNFFDHSRILPVLTEDIVARKETERSDT
jgi:hypothetical protein